MAIAMVDFETLVPDEHRMLMREFSRVDLGLARGLEDTTGFPMERVERDGIRMMARHGKYDGRYEVLRKAELKVDYYLVDQDVHPGVDWREVQFTTRGGQAAVIGYTAMSGFKIAPETTNKGQEMGMHSYSAVLHVLRNTLWTPEQG